MRSKLLSMVLAGALCVGMLSGCGGRTASNEGGSSASSDSRITLP